MIANLQRAVAGTAALFVFASSFLPAWAGDGSRDGAIHLRAQLIWGTNDDFSPNPNHKEVDFALRKKLANVFKWKSYFEVHRQEASIPQKGTKRLKLSAKCEVEIKNLGGGQITAKLYGEGKLQADHRYNTTRKEPLILGSEDKNKTAWFVILSPL